MLVMEESVMSLKEGTRNCLQVLKFWLTC